MANEPFNIYDLGLVVLYYKVNCTIKRRTIFYPGAALSSSVSEVQMKEKELDEALSKLSIGKPIEE